MKFSMAQLSSAIISSSIGLLVCSCATTGGGFPAADTDNDGMLSVAEVETTLIESILASSDTNQDGLVSLAEWQRSNPEADSDLFKARDLNGDGKMDYKEAKAAADQSERWARLLANLDANNNQVVEDNEAVAFRRMMDKADGETPVSKLLNTGNER